MAKRRVTSSIAGRWKRARPEIRPAYSGMPGVLPLEDISFSCGKIEWTYALMTHQTGRSVGDVKVYWNFVHQPGHLISAYRRLDDNLLPRFRMQCQKSHVLYGHGGN